METLEGSTLDLLYRRRVRTFYPGYIIILLLAGMILSLPLVKVSVVANASGLVRNCNESLELYPATSGIVELSLLEDFRQVSRGDTLLQLSMALPLARLEEMKELEKYNSIYINDIHTLLNKGSDPHSSRYRQALKMYRSKCSSLELERDFLKEEYQCMEDLHREKAIPSREYEQAKSQYLLACMEVEDCEESFHSRLEDELARLELENLRLGAEREQILVSLPSYHILAPADGILSFCPGIRKGSVLNAGNRVGSLVIPGSLVAECHVESRHMDQVWKGMKVRIKMEGNGHLERSWLISNVESVGAEALIVDGRPVYRVRCPLSPDMWEKNVSHPMAGMRFTASLELNRCSLSSLLMKKVNRHFHPVLALDRKGEARP